jgi:predicted branched-subunit amino acid permease
VPSQAFMNSSYLLWDFLSSVVAPSRYMSPADEVSLSLLLVALFGLLFVLRIKFPDASRGSETAVLLSVIVLFFSICNFFSSPRSLPIPAGHQPTRTVDAITR